MIEARRPTIRELITSATWQHYEIFLRGVRQVAAWSFGARFSSVYPGFPNSLGTKKRIADDRYLTDADIERLEAAADAWAEAVTSSRRLGDLDQRGSKSVQAGTPSYWRSLRAIGGVFGSARHRSDPFQHGRQRNAAQVLIAAPVRQPSRVLCSVLAAVPPAARRVALRSGVRLARIGGICRFARFVWRRLGAGKAWPILLSSRRARHG